MMRWAAVVLALTIGCEAVTDDLVADASQGADVVAPSVCTAADCDDGLACTEDACVEGACTWTVADGTCLIGGTCRFEGEREVGSHGETCRVCAPATSATQWSVVDDGAACGADACVVNPVCQAGECAGTARECAAEACQTAACDPVDGCEVSAFDTGSSCDGGPCVVEAVCLVGACVGAPAKCDDGDPCTADACDEDGACTHVAGEGACEDGDVCTQDDTCVDGACVGGERMECDDGNQCTIDTCQAATGCVWLPEQTPCCVDLTAVCDDGDPCTEDACNPFSAECTFTPLDDVPCDDGSACTTDTTCSGGVCLGTPVPCDDGESCTADSCDPEVGCVTAALSGPACDDGLECSTGDLCVAGECTADTSECACVPTLPLPVDGLRLATLQIGGDGHPGSGLDIDLNPATCSPAGDCSEGIDNAFAPMAALANEPLADALTGGDITLLVQLPEAASGPFDLAIYEGKPVGACDLSQTCSWEIYESSFDPINCSPLFLLPAVLDGTSLTAGGPQSTLPFEVPLQGAVLAVTLSRVQLHGELVIEDGDVVGMTGALGGALRQSELLAALYALDPSQLPAPPDAIAALLDTLIDYDVDTTGDGEPDAASIGLPTTAQNAVLVGVE